MLHNILRSFILLAASFPFQTDVFAASLVSAKKVEINVDSKKTEIEREALWKKIGGWCAVSDWHPSVSNCIEKREGNQLVRVLTFKDGNTSKDKLLEQGTSSYKYEILETTFPVQSFQGMFSVSPDDEDLDELHVQWSATYNPKDNDPKEVQKLMDKVIGEGILNVKSKFGRDDELQKDND